MNVATVRRTVTLPAVGVFTEIPVSGYGCIIELSDDVTVADVPVLHFNTQGSSPFPGYSGAQYLFPDRFERLFIEGTAASGSIHLLIITSKGVDVAFPSIGI